MKYKIILLAILIILLVAVLSLAKTLKPLLPTVTPTPSVTATPVTGKENLIRVATPLPNSEITNPLIIKGEARGTWFFEASFPIYLTDWDGKIIGQGIAQADGEWMTTEFVPFTATLEYTQATSTYSNRGTLILKKDNPSGLPEHDDALEIPVVIR